MAAVDAACPKGHTGEAYRVVKDGYVETRAGPRQLLRCISVEGTAHRFRGGFVEPVVPVLIGEAVRCPKAGHKDATIRSKGTRATRTGTWRRFECLRPNGERHWFKVMQTEVLTPASRSDPCCA